jgi:hypothetical protein
MLTEMKAKWNRFVMVYAGILIDIPAVWFIKPLFPSIQEWQYER